MNSFFNVILFLTVCFASNAQLSKGLNPREAKDMAAICNSFTYLDLYKDDKAIIPSGYKKVYTSPSLGMDNRFQIYTKGRVGVINFRGSTSKKISWMENLHSAMIPISGEIKIHEKVYKYRYGTDEKANVHSGYALGLAYMQDEIIEQINSLNRKGIYHILITGHSQGGALAVLLRSWLAHSKAISSKNVFKVYTFAQPMSGNFEFAQEYNRRFCASEMSYSFVNPKDMVPSMPISYNDTTFLRDQLVKVITNRDEVEPSHVLQEGLMLLFKDKLKSTAEKFGGSVDKQIRRELGNIELPHPTGEINFSQVGNLHKILPPEYPLEMRDSSLLQDSAFMATHERDEHGVFYDKRVYKKVTMMQHHKPYNYYTGILRKYFPREYEAIEPKSFGL